MSSDDRPAVRLRVITPEQIVFDGPVAWAQIPLEDGLLGVWPDHAPLVAATSEGEIEFSHEGRVRRMPVGAGVLRIDASHCVVMFGATVELPEPERDLEPLALQMEEALFEGLERGDVEDMQLE